jgi:site-specific DNA-methyltransferase (adenine-specific)
LGKAHETCVVHYPRQLLEIKCERGLHPTQKPVALFAYLIRTYTNPGALVLDSCIGSGTTAVACIKSGRKYTGFELDHTYYHTATECIKRLQGSS